MPRIPIQTQQFQPTQEQSVQPLQATFGGNIAQAQYQTGKVVEQIGQQFQAQQEKIDALQKKQKEEQDKIKSVYLQNEIKQNFNSYLYDPDKGLLTKSGVNAFGATNEFTKEAYEKLRPEFERKLKSSGIDEDTKLYELAKFDSDLNTYQKQVSEHEAKEQKSAYKNAFNSSLDMNYQELAQYRNEPHYYGMLNRSRNEIYEYGKKNGWTDGEIEVKRVTEATRMFGLIVEPLIEDQPKEAERLLKDNKPFIDPVKFITYENQTSKSKDFKITNTIAYQISDKHGTNLSDAIAELKTVKLPADLYDKAEDILVSNINRNKSVEREKIDNYQTIVKNKYEDLLKSGNIKKVKQLINSIPNNMIDFRDSMNARLNSNLKPEKQPDMTNDQLTKLNALMKTGKLTYAYWDNVFSPFMTESQRSSFIFANFDENKKFIPESQNEKALQDAVIAMTWSQAYELTGSNTLDKHLKLRDYVGKYQENWQAENPGKKLTNTVFNDAILSAKNKIAVETVGKFWGTNKNQVSIYEADVHANISSKFVYGKDGNAYILDKNGNLKLWIKDETKKGSK